MPDIPAVVESHPCSCSAHGRQAADRWTTKISSVVWSVTWHVGDTLGDALLILKKPVSLLLALLAIISFALFTLSSTLDYALGSANLFDPCKIPIASRVMFSCASTPPGHKISSNAVAVPLERADFPSLITVQHRALDEFLGFSNTGTDLSANLKHAELAVQDLIVLVRASTLTVKEELAQALTDFVVDAKGAARGLNALSSKIYGTLDDVLLYNDFALRTLAPAKSDDIRSTLALSFWSSMNGFAAQVTGILVQAAATSVSLDRLEERLLSVHALCMEQAIMTATAQEELLWTLWTILGGNREQLRDLNHRLSVLRSVRRYRDTAMAYVAATTHSLHAVESDLSELRERLGAAGDHEDTESPLEIQVASIERSVQRLRQEKVRIGRGANGIEPRVD